ncbi:glycine betaine ABC transporter substrate-binding protein [Umezawaea sp.]|uniref:glycine betaine ABC transporter substrate-binding protein n=1 Tax=Umezawaea sp. TaxID=1955258 RepID=UPI002ED42727
MSPASRTSSAARWPRPSAPPRTTAWLAALQQAGVDPGAVTLVDLEPQNIQAAWQRGDVDAAYVWTPVLSVLQQDGVTLTDSATLAAAGKPTLTFTVARTEFIDGNRDVVDRWLEATNRAIGLVKTDPGVVAEAVSRQIGSSKEDAVAQLEQNVYLDHAEQRGPEYFGTAEAPGKLAERLRDTAQFLHGQKKIEAVPDVATFRAALLAPGADDGR